MYQVRVDPHTHTLASGHAFSTIGENVAAAKAASLEAIGMADHFGPVFSNGDVPGFGVAMNMPALPRTIEGVTVLASTEIDIVDFDGHVGFWDKPMPFKRQGDPEDMTVNTPMLDSRDYAIASVHGFPGCGEGTVSQNTEMYCRVLENPKIHIIGHPGRAGMRFDLEEVCKTAKAYGKMLEINEHSFDSDSTVTNECCRIAQCCAQIGTKVVISSDAHSAWFVGRFVRALTMLEKIDFPEELIANRTLEEFMQTIKACK